MDQLTPGDLNLFDFHRVVGWLVSDPHVALAGPKKQGGFLPDPGTDPGIICRL